MSRILFLDFDDVLHPTHFAGEDPFNRTTILQEALSDASTEIVICFSQHITRPPTHMTSQLNNMNNISVILIIFYQLIRNASD